MPSSIDGDFVPAARIGKARGAKGEVWLEFLQEDRPPLDPGDLVGIGSGDPSDEFRVEYCFEYSKGVVLKVEGVDTPREAERLRDRRLWIPRDRMPPEPEGAFDTGDILGHEVLDRGRGLIGTVRGVYEGKAYWILRVEGSRGEFEVPMVRGYAVEIDAEGRRVTLDIPAPWPGLDEGASLPPRDGEEADAAPQETT